MAWSETNPMDQKVLFISDYLRQLDSISELCRRFGISRKTGYKWLKRYRLDGLDGLKEQSKKPLTHPHKTPYAITQRIIELRTQTRATLGARKLQCRLQSEFDDKDIPSVSTINNILKREGLNKPKKRHRRFDRYPNPLRAGEQPNELWSVDFKGQFQLTNGQWCYPLTVMDDYSRYLLGVQSQHSIGLAETQKHFEALFREYGLPERIRSDNGTPFASNAISGLSQLSIWWIQLGILPERTEPGKPQQNGKHERMHLTLKRDVCVFPSASFSAQQRSFNAFRHSYNHERPHEALEQQLPAKVYTSSTRPFPEKLPSIEYPSYFQVLKVGTTGMVYLCNAAVYVNHLLKHKYVGIEQIEEDQFDVYFNFYRIGHVNLKQSKTSKYKGKNKSYTTIKV